ncbi:hypothetical protein AWM68_03235 [Fictibacillus phosphorivorans]|uniref:Uncharacterized protein n=1 Tax=Fictibacillus phosphorivorans TaxID=1221500 RepID=A0A161TJ87_9BACL|nr:hypothetical protein [Fictibacillus phosphorivorans]KZE69294.1 hypothetical protein AWM68_03235 [Fictibacillus phosphorivorans]
MAVFQSVIFWIFLIMPIVLFFVAIARTSWVLMLVNLFLTLPLVWFVSWITEKYGAVFVVIVIHLATGVWLWTKRQRLDFRSF